MARLKVHKAGTIIFKKNRIETHSWVFKGDADFTDDNQLAAIRDYVVKRISEKKGIPPLRLKEEKVAPISLQNERAAELETYILINRLTEEQ